MTVIGLMGYAQAGKDSVAKVLVEKHGLTRYAFADALKDQVLQLNPTLWTDECGCCSYTLQEAVDQYGWERVKGMYGGEARRLLQVYGQMRRDENPGYWINKIEQKIPAKYGNFVITDIRHENEVDYIRAYKGKIVLVERPGFGPINGHASDRPIWESYRCRPDYIIHNHSDVSTLEGITSMLARDWETDSSKDA